MGSIRMESAGKGEDESPLAAFLASYLLLGGSSYDETFPRIATSQDVEARLVLAQLLGRVPGPQAEEVLIEMLSDGHAIVQGEVARQLTRRDPEKAGPTLLAHLAQAGDGWNGPQKIMDPLLNHVDGGKLEMIRALGDLKYEPAGPALLELLGRTVRVLLEALEKLGRRDYIQALDRCLQDLEGIRVVAEWAGEKHLVELEPALRRQLEGEAPIEVIDALGKIGDQTTATRLIGVCVS